MGDDNAAAPTLPWSDSFKVGIDALDADHRALLGSINEISACWCGDQRAEALQAMDSLCALADEHFQREEGVLRALEGRGDPEVHAGEHSNRMKQLIALRQRFEEAKPPGGPALCYELIDWFVRQIIGRDAAIKARFADRETRFLGHPVPRKAF